jgi:hypothetical protein
MYQQLRLTILVIASILLTACSSQPATKLYTRVVDAGTLPATPAGLDHYVAWIPLEQAQTASVAEAMTHISLRNARDQLSNDVCGGKRITAGVVVERHGPVAVRTPASMGAYPAWYYRISQQPGLSGCRAEHSTMLYQGLQTRLPDWITIQTGTAIENRTAGLLTTP